MFHETLHRNIADNMGAQRKFQRQAKRLLHRLATNGMGLRRNDFNIRVRDAASSASGLVSLQTDHWYIALSAPVAGKLAEVRYAPCKGRKGRPTGEFHHAGIDSVLDVHKFARHLQSRPELSVRPREHTAPLRRQMRR